jgi:pimeloyl-ACP methyl ester carboxylesterase
MTKTSHLHPADIRGISRLAFDATTGMTDLVEAMHRNIAGVAPILGTPRQGPTRGITGLVYGSVRGVTRLLGSGIDVLLAQLVPLLGERRSSPEREAGLAALNGVLGDHLVATRNPLATSMRLRRNGHALDLDRQALAAAIPRPTSKLVVLLHGLCMSDLQWTRQGHNHGEALEGDLGYTPVYLHYNSGLHISSNGQAFADWLEGLTSLWPVPLQELVIIGHSMGGLVCRSACHYGAAARHGWLQHLRKIVFLGTPHHGAPLERGGNWLNVTLGASPYTSPFARLGKIRSAGITDLRYGSLLTEDWEGRDRFAHAGDQRQAVPLPDGVRCYAIGATTGKKAGDLKDKLLGDGLVPLESALGRHQDPSLTLPIPQSHQWIGYGMGHLDLLHRPEVYAQIRQWLS